MFGKHKYLSLLNMARPRTNITLRYIYKRRDIKEGGGKHFVEFDASSSEVTVVTNPITGATEHIFSGDVLLDNRNPIFSPL